MAKFNFLTHRAKPTEVPETNFLVRTRATAKDPYEGLRGRDYINARKTDKVQTSTQNNEVRNG